VKNVGKQKPDIQLSPHFFKSEFTCKCGCGFSEVTVELLNFLEGLRAYMCITLGREYPITIISGCRCEAHNRAEHGKDGSRHLPPVCKAADLECHDDHERFLIIAYAIQHGVRGIGITKSRIHVDIDTKGNRAIWPF
jgi:zinc D-Ala-D-Ala carboxypeptidase